MLDNKTSYNGDRILVSKLAYEIGEPERWDVIVFKYPGDPPEFRRMHPEESTDSRINFIKRLVGLPGDTIRIENGDVWIKTAKDKKELGDKAQFVIARKPPRKLLAMLQPVFDNDYMPAIAKDGWPARWFSAAEDAAGDWHTDDSGTVPSSAAMKLPRQVPANWASYAIDGSAKTEKWLRYHHLVPPDDWQQNGSQPPTPQQQLITDFTAYDTSKMRMYADPRPGPQRFRHWHALGR